MQVIGVLAALGDLGPLRRIVEVGQAGVVELENPDTLKRRIEEASKFVPPDQLCLSPQCGFSSTVEGNVLSYEQEVAKLELIVKVAQEVWG